MNHRKKIIPILTFLFLSPGLVSPGVQASPERIVVKLTLNFSVPSSNYWQVDFSRDKVLGVIKDRHVVLPEHLTSEAKLGVTRDGDAIVLVFEKILGGKAIRLLVDTNQNNDLTDEKAIQFAVDRQPGDLGPIVTITRFAGPDRSRPVALPYYFIYFESKGRDGKTEETYAYGGHYCAEGIMISGPEEHKVRVSDLLIDGRFDLKDLRQGTAIVIDLNKDGSYGEKEYFWGDSLIPLAGKYYLPEDVAPDGTEITFRSSDLRPLNIGDLSPDIPLTDTTGKTFRLSDFRGRFVLLDFWASWCIYCVREFPAVKEAAAKHTGKPLEIIGINTDQANSLDKADQVIQQYGLPWRQIMAGKGTSIPIAQLFMSTAEMGFSVPLYIVIDAQGRIRDSSFDFKKIETVLGELINAAKAP